MRLILILAKHPTICIEDIGLQPERLMTNPDANFNMLCELYRHYDYYKLAPVEITAHYCHAVAL